MWNRFGPRPNAHQPFVNPYGQELLQQAGGFPWQAGRVPQSDPYLFGDALIGGCAQPQAQPQPKPQPQPQAIHPLFDNKPPEKPWLGPPPPPRFSRLHQGGADSEMRSRQLKYNTLGPQERQEQDIWVTEQIKLSGVCPAGYGWRRDEMGKRYICQRNFHVITDEDLAQGRGSIALSFRDKYGGGDKGRRRTGWERPKSKKKKKGSWW